jgi:hypothetical protein
VPDLPPGLHLSGRQAGQHAAAAGAGHLVLTHLAPDYDPALSLAGAKRSLGRSPSRRPAGYSTWISLRTWPAGPGQRAILSARAARSQGIAPSPLSDSALIISPLAARAET